MTLHFALSKFFLTRSFDVPFACILQRQLSQAPLPSDPYTGYVRSKHVKLQHVCVEQADGSIKKIPSGLIDNSTEWIGDQFTHYHLKITQRIDWTMGGFAERARKRLLASNKRRQQISTENIQHLGLDLALAHMICNIGGRVQFAGINHWFQRYNKTPSDLPNSYAGDLKLQVIDASGTPIMYEGFDLLLEMSLSDSNAAQLTELRILRLRQCVHVDDHCLSVAGQITESPLQLLDVSECPRLTANGLTALTELKSLQKLIVSGNPMMEDREFVCLLLEDYLPRVYIEGVDYLGQLPEASRQRLLALEAPLEHLSASCLPEDPSLNILQTSPKSQNSSESNPVY